MRLRVLGGSGEQGRACFAVSTGRADASVLLDAGVKRSPTVATSEVYPRFDLLPSAPSAVVLSHAHEDHAGALPCVPGARDGNRPPIYATSTAAQDARSYCRTWLRTAVARGLDPPYSDEDVEGLDFRPLEHRQAVDLDGGLRVTVGAAGHVPGSSWTRVDEGARTLLYTGDWSSESWLLAPPTFPIEADVVLLDASYGALTLDQGAAADALVTRIREVGRGGGSVLLPLPRLGRSQEILLLLAAQADTLPPIWVARPIIDAVDRFRGLSDLSEMGRSRLSGFDASRVRAFSGPDEIPAAGPVVLLATDGMLTGGLAVPLLERWLARDPASSVLLTGYQAPGTPGERLLHDTSRNVLCGVEYHVWKVHPDWRETERFLVGLQSRPRVYAVHAEPAAGDAVVQAVRSLGLEAEMLRVGDEREI